MTRRGFPFWPTLLVGLAIATMVGLGVWQLQRMEWKNGLLELYADNADKPPVAWPTVPVEKDAPFFRKSRVNCIEVVDWRATSGRNARGEAGWVHIAGCRTGGAEGPGAQVVAGWSTNARSPTWSGGEVNGVIAPDSRHIIRLVATTPIAGLTTAQVPTPDDIPNNHLAYAVQWFIFAGIALVIYVLALRRRKRPV